MGAKQTGVPLCGVIAAGLGVLAALADWRTLLGCVVVLTLGFGISCLLLVMPRQDTTASWANPSTGLTKLFRDANYGRFVLANLLFNFGQGNFFRFLTLFVRKAVQGSKASA